MRQDQKIKLARIKKKLDPSSGVDDFVQDQLLSLHAAIPSYFEENIAPYATNDDIKYKMTTLESFVTDQIEHLSEQSDTLSKKHSDKQKEYKAALEALISAEDARLNKELRAYFSHEKKKSTAELDTILAKIRNDIEELFWTRTINGSNNVQAVLGIKNNGVGIATNVTGINFTSNLTVTTNPDGTVSVSATGGSGSSPQIPTGTVNGVNNTFTAATTPKIVFTEGGTFTNGFGVTITALSIVFAAGLQPQSWIYYI